MAMSWKEFFLRGTGTLGLVGLLDISGVWEKLSQLIPESWSNNWGITHSLKGNNHNTVPTILKAQTAVKNLNYQIIKDPSKESGLEETYTTNIKWVDDMCNRMKTPKDSEWKNSVCINWFDKNWLPQKGSTYSWRYQ